MSDQAEVTADVAVVGLGLIGSAALAHLASTGAVTVGIGPDEPPVLADHDGAFASHYDSGRITRHLDPRREWAVLAARSIAGYAALEAASGMAFHRPTGAVMAELDPGRISATVTNAAAMGVPVVVVADGAPSPFGDRLAFPARSTLLCEPAPAGHVDPRRMLAANLAVARRAGARTVADEVVELVAAGARWRLRTRHGPTVDAEQVLVAAGPHADELLPGSAGAAPQLAVRGEAVVLATLDASEQARWDGLPSVLARLSDHPTYDDLYLVPPTRYPDGTVRAKLGATRRTHLDLPTAQDKRAWMRGDDHRAELPELRALLEDLVPGMRATAWSTRPCLITETPSDLPYVDHLAPGLVVAAGGNGYAAKSANAIGRLGADLLASGRWSDPDLEAAAFAIGGRSGS
jgi:sarcosine oxidase